MARILLRLLLALAALCTSAAHADVAAVDDAGRTVHLAAPARRIASLAPHLTELLFAIGAGRQLTAATEYSDYPAAAKSIPRVGGLAGIDLEALVATRPDLVVAWQSGTSQAQLDAIERLGIPVFRSEPRTLDDVATTMERLGRLTGHDPEAGAGATAFRARVDSLRSMYASRTPVRVFYQVWSQPLMTVGGTHLISHVVALCGGRNVFASLTLLAPTIDPESVIAADPQLIITASGDGTRTAELAMWAQWPGIAAVRHRRYLVLDPGVITRHTPRILDGAEAACRAIDAARADR